MSQKCYSWTEYLWLLTDIPFWLVLLTDRTTAYNNRLFHWVSGSTTNKYFRGDISDSYYWFYKFPNQFIWFSDWICIACFLYHMFSLFFCAVEWIRKDIPTKLQKYFFHLNQFENDSEFFWTEEPLYWLCCRTGTTQSRA